MFSHRTSPQAHPSGDPVIWRVGLYGAVPARRFEISRLATTRVLQQLQAPDPVFAGLLAQSVDALRRPMWTPKFEQNLAPGSAWSLEPPAYFHPACGALTIPARASLPAITSTFLELEALGVPIRPDAASRQPDGSLWISIETVARCTSLPHEDCIEPTSRPSAHVGRDQRMRVWFRLDGVASREFGTRAAVVALAEPREALEEWIHTKSGRISLEHLDVDMLHGLADIAVTGGGVQAELVRVHLAAARANEATDVLLRSARVPDGQSGHAHSASRVRKAMLDVASILADAYSENPYFEREDAWLLLAAAGAQLRTVASDDPLIVTTSFLRRRWAPRVRAMVQRSEPPAWFDSVAEAAHELPADTRTLHELVVRLTYSRGVGREGRARTAARTNRAVWGLA